MVKRLILLGFLITLLIGIPLALFVLQNQTQPTTGAAPVTKFSFDGPTSVNLNQTFDVKIVVDPTGGATPNQISFVKFAFTFDNTKLDKVGSNPVSIDTNTYTVLEQPQINCTSGTCTVTATISVGQNNAAIIKTKTPVAIVHLTAIANTDAGPTQLLFLSGQNQALSVASSDQPAQNVFTGSIPLSITIGASGIAGSGTPTATPTTSVGTPGNPGTTGTTGGPGGTGTTGTGNLSVSCTSFTPSVVSGNPPLAVTFTTVGQSTTDSITRIDLNYGDGVADTVASGSGIGTGNVNNQMTHTYGSAGSFTATAKLTTAGGATSDPSTCTATISVGNVSPTPVSKLPPTGPGQTLLIIGGIGGLITTIGAFILFAL